jgi:hypothetical protein
MNQFTRRGFFGSLLGVTAGTHRSRPGITCTITLALAARRRLRHELTAKWERELDCSSELLSTLFCCSRPHSLVPLNRETRRFARQ